MKTEYTRDEQIAILAAVAAPLALGQAKKDDKGVLHITARDVADRLNSVCPADWQFYWEEVQDTSTDDFIVKGKLVIAGVEREDIGIGKAEAWGGKHKAGVSGALKRCAVLFGFAAELYEKDLAWKSGQRTAHPDKNYGAPPPRPQKSLPIIYPQTKVFMDENGDNITVTEHGHLVDAPKRSDLGHYDTFQLRGRYYGYSTDDLNIYLNENSSIPIWTFKNFASDGEIQSEVLTAFNDKWAPKKHDKGVHPEIMPGWNITLSFECSEPGITTRAPHNNPIVFLVGASRLKVK